MNDEQRPADEETLAMTRADEAMYIQEASEAAPSPAPRPPEADATRGAVLRVVDTTPPGPPTAVLLLRLIAAALALTAAIGVSYRAVSDLVASQGEPVALPEAPAAATGDTISVLMLIDSKPSGATVTVDGVVRGETPAVFNAECALGSSIRAEFEKRGFLPTKAEAVCAVNETAGLRLKVKLQRK